MIFLMIQFNFRDIVMSVLQAHDDFCIKVISNKMATEFQTKRRPPPPHLTPEIHAMTGTILVGNHNG